MTKSIISSIKSGYRYDVDYLFSDTELIPDDVQQRRNKAHTKRQSRYEKTAKGRAYVSKNGKRRRRVNYDTRPIMAWDGEGVTIGERHYYTLLACLAEDDGVLHSIRDDSGIGWAAWSDFLMDMHERYPDHLHVIYGGNYDFNMMIHSLPLSTAEQLYKHGHARFDDYVLRWRPSKNFGIRHNSDKRSLTIHDVVSFFQRPFVQACDEYLGTDWEGRDRIIENKARRGTFTIEDNTDVDEYNAAELRNLVRLVRELRQRMASVDLRPIRFDGPGSVAGELMRREGTKQAMAVLPDEPARAARFAYAGGRFEPPKFGWFGPAHEYDIQSAYPSAMRKVPNLARGVWVHHNADDVLALSDFSLVHLRTHAFNENIPGPMFCRHHDGTVSYPTSCENWVWGPEYGAIYEWADAGHGTVEVLESWEFVETNYDDKPFAFINNIYRQRQELKAAGNGAQIALKLAINSLYGKTAQQLGAWFDGHNWHVPSYHQIEWAGYTTASCRAAILRAAIPVMDHIIAFETDALFSDIPLEHLPVSDQLGDFEHVAFDELIYVQSGVYATRNARTWKPSTDTWKLDHEGWSIKSRGIDRGFLTVDMLENGLTNNESIPAPLTRFVMIGSALRNGIDQWCTWNTLTKHLHPGPAGKRIHDDINCPTCKGHTGPGFARGPHLTVCPLMGDNVSIEYPIAWINPNPGMRLEEFRRDNVDGDWD